jgi:hypothetical protein
LKHFQQKLLKVESKVLKVETLSTETVESGWRANRGNCSFTPTSITDLYIYVGDRLAWNPFEHFSRMVLVKHARSNIPCQKGHTPRRHGRSAHFRALAGRPLMSIL